MTSKRDVQIVRLACRWRWMTAEDGEDCLVLKRKLGAKRSIEEIILRRGYLDAKALQTLAEAADQATGRRRPLFRRASTPSPRPVAERREQTVVRAIELIAPPAPAPRVSRRPRPAGPSRSTPPAPSSTPAPSRRPARRLAVPRQGTEVDPIPPVPGLPAEPAAIEPDGLPTPAPVGYEAPSELPIPEVVAPSSEMSGEFEEPSLPATSQHALPPAEVTRFEPSPWFVREAEERIEEPALPDVVRERTRSRVNPIPRDDTRYDPVGSSALGPTDSAPPDGGERTVIAKLPEEFLRRLRADQPEVEVEAPPAPPPPDRAWPVAPSLGLPEPEDEFDVDVDVEVEAPDSGPMGMEPLRPEDFGPAPRTPSRITEEFPVDDVSGLLPVPSSQTLARGEVDPEDGPTLDGAPNPQGLGHAALAEDFGAPSSGVQLPPELVFAPPPPPLMGVEPLVGEPSPEGPTYDGGPEYSLLEEGVAEDLLGIFGPYELERIVARGVRSIVYLGRAAEGGPPVAVKVLAEDPQRNAAFIAERGGLLLEVARLGAPELVRVLDVGRVDARHYVALEYVEGWTLAEKLAFENAPPTAQALRWAAQVARALAAAHQQGILHGDLRPDRVLIDNDGRSRLGGFGFAPMAPVPDDTFTPPEGRLPATAAGDAFGLGGVLFAALGLGLHPQAGVPGAGLEAAPQQLLDRLLDPEPAARPIDFEQIAEAFDIWAEADQPSSSAPARGARPPLQSIAGRAGAVSVLLLAITLGLSFVVRTLGLSASHTAQLVLQSAFAGAVALTVATLLLATLDLIRRGELPLPMSAQWLVQVAEGAGAIGALACAVGLVLGPPAWMNLLVAVLGVTVLLSAVFGVVLRRAVARTRPDRGIGRILAVLSDPWIERWRALHGTALTLVTFLATARFALLAYFAAY